jgi:hypothetical protein
MIIMKLYHIYRPKIMGDLDAFGVKYDLHGSLLLTFINFYWICFIKIIKVSVYFLGLFIYFFSFFFLSAFLMYNLFHNFLKISLF